MMHDASCFMDSVANHLEIRNMPSECTFPKNLPWPAFGQAAEPQAVKAGNHWIILRTLVLVCLSLWLVACVDPDDVPQSHISTPPPGPEPGEVRRYPLRTALFGDLHVHTSWSADAYAGGNRLGPNTAYRFAKGEQVELQNGVQAQLPVPLDFVALTDHAEFFGSHLVCTMPGSPEFDLPQCRALRAGEIDQETFLERAFAFGGTRPMPRLQDTCSDLARCQDNERTTWKRVQELANAHDNPGQFTALIGYEFSSLLPEFGMLHRNVIFRGTDVTAHAISSLDVRNQKDFFNQLDAACVEPCEVLTIPHNTNYSWGLTFSRTDEDDTVYTSEDLQRRARIERLFEVTQQKGNSECQISVGASDEDCNLGILFPPCADGNARRCARENDFLRNVLLDGLALGNERDFNPYKLGVIGSTDTHMSDSGNTRPGILPLFEPAAGLGFAVDGVLAQEHVVVGPVRLMSPGGLAGVWAEANTREAIFDALQRREAFATSGSRIRLRFFGGNLPEDLGAHSNPVEIAYEQGVPMGSNLVSTQGTRFWVWAIKDPAGPPLDRIQIIKGWIEDGEHRQRIWDVACSSGRVPDENGRCPKTTADADLATCRLIGEQGAAELQATFSDADFSIEHPAFYYARVLENPTCRWTTLLVNSVGAEVPADIPATVQERAWSSPIWSASP